MKKILVVLSEWGFWGEELVGPLDELLLAQVGEEGLEHGALQQGVIQVEAGHAAHGGASERGT